MHHFCIFCNNLFILHYRVLIMKLKCSQLHIGMILSLIIIQMLGINAQTASAVPEESPTGIILFIGDGMGPEHVELGRLVEYGPEGESAIRSFPYSTRISTDSIDKISTDSAASATTIATGVKTRNGRISTNFNAKMNLTTIIEIAQENNYSTGIVATCHLTHATPAAFMAHDENRNNYIAIAEDIAKAEVDVLLGGGRGDKYLGTQIASMEADGYSYITNASQLATSNILPLVGLFVEGSLTPNYENFNLVEEPSLLEMTKKAISMLNNTGNPFFLMVEGSQIDWGAHDNEVTYTTLEVIEFEKAVKYAKELGDSDPNLQILVTTDHETGGLNVTGYNFVSPLPNDAMSNTLLKETRIDRSSEVQVSWSTGGHTRTKVYLSGMGPNTEKILAAEHHEDTFSIMREIIDGEIVPEGDGWYRGYVNVIVWYSLGGIGIVGVITSFILVIVNYKKKKKNMK